MKKKNETKKANRPKDQSEEVNPKGGGRLDGKDVNAGSKKRSGKR